MKTTSWAVILLFLIALIPSCKKDNDSGTPPGGHDTTFTPFKKLADFVPANHSVAGMDYHAPTKNLYFYISKSTVKGYSIMQLNTETKQALIVFTFNDGQWSNTNGSEGKRIRIFGNELYVMGGATNEHFHRLTGIGNNTLTLAKVIKMPISSSPHWGESYDVAVADRLYVMTMRDKITYGSKTDLSSPGSFTLAFTTHGASVLYASKDGNGYLLSKGGNDGKIEVRNPVNGNFLRAVTIESDNSTTLAKDSKDRVYIIDNNNVLRYSPDLLTKEEFAIKDANTNYQFAIAEESNFVRIYQNSSGEIKTAKVPM